MMKRILMMLTMLTERSLCAQHVQNVLHALKLLFPKTSREKFETIRLMETELLVPYHSPGGWWGRDSSLGVIYSKTQSCSILEPSRLRAKQTQPKEEHKLYFMICA